MNYDFDPDNEIDLSFLKGMGVNFLNILVFWLLSSCPMPKHQFYMLETRNHLLQDLAGAG